MEELEEKKYTVKTLKDIGISEIKKYSDSRRSAGMEAATVRRELSPLSKVFRIAQENGNIGFNPVSAAKRALPRGRSRSAYLLFADVERIADHCPDWFQAVIWVAYYTGMRRGEIEHLRHSHVDLGARMITLQASDTKEGRPKRIPLRMEAVAILERWMKVQI